MNLTEEYTKSVINRLLQNSVTNAVTGCWEWRDMGRTGE